MNRDNRNTANLRNTASFEIEVYSDIYWVSANILGQTRYKNNEIEAFLKLDPEEKRRKINNLYEAIQLFQTSKFKGIIDNVRIIEESTACVWVFHKNGFDAVRTNEGCCAADSNWLSYILEDKYEEIGCFGYCQADGNGHITNYIKSGGWYYFLDMMMQRYDSVKESAGESGNISDYTANPPSAFIHKVKSFEDYIKYCLSVGNNPPIVFYRTQKPQCVCVGNEFMWRKNPALNGFDLVLKSEKFLFYKNTVEILYSKTEDSYEFRNSRAVEPDWAAIKSYDFE